MTTARLAVQVGVQDMASAMLREITKNTAAVGKAASDSSRQFSAFGSVLRGAASVASGMAIFEVFAAGARAVSQQITSLVQVADAMEDVGIQAQKLNLSVEETSTLRYIADANKIGFEDLARSFVTARVRMNEFALTGKGEAADALGELGVSVTNADGSLRGLRDVLPEIARSIQDIADPERRADLSRAIFGRSGDDVLRVLGDVRRGFSEMSVEARRVNAVLGQDAVDAATRFQDSLDRIRAAMFGLRARLVTEFAPAITEAINSVAFAVGALPEIVENVQAKFGTLVSGSGADADVRQFFRTLEKLLEASMAAVGTLVIALIYDMGVLIKNALMFLFEAIGRDIVLLINGLFFDGVKVMLNNIISLNQSIESVLGEVPGVTPMLKQIRDYYDAARLVIDLNERVQNRNGFDAFREAVVSQSTAMAGTIQTMRVYVDELGIVGRRAFEQADRILGVTDAIARVRKRAEAEANAEPFGPPRELMNRPARRYMTETEEFDRIQTPPEVYTKERLAQLNEIRTQVQEIGPVAELTSFTIGNGFAAGFADAVEAARDASEQIRSITSRVFDSVAFDLSFAITNVIEGTKSMKDAFRDFASSTLRMVGQLIMQMLILRSLASIAGAFAGGGLSGPKGIGEAVPSGGLQSLAKDVSVGGLPASLPGFATGGMVTGSGEVLARLHPPEFVVNPRGTRANDRGVLDYMNRGGRVAPVGSGGGGATNITYAPTVNVYGSANAQDVQQALDSSAERFLAELDRRPVLLEQLRGKLA